MEPATLVLLSAGGGLIGFLLSGFEALRRQSDLQSGANSHSNSTRQAWPPVEAGHDSKATGSVQQLRPFHLTSRGITSRS